MANKTYEVVVTELRRKVVLVDASNETKAHQRVSDAWYNGEYLLTEKDFDGAEFHVLGEHDGNTKQNFLHVEGKEK